MDTSTRLVRCAAGYSVWHQDIINGVHQTHAGGNLLRVSELSNVASVAAAQKLPVAHPVYHKGRASRQSAHRGVWEVREVGPDYVIAENLQAPTAMRIDVYVDTPCH